MEVQSGMLGTREPVTPCLAAQKPQGFLIGGPTGCAWKQASPTTFLLPIYDPRKSSKLVRKMEVSWNNIVNGTQLIFLYAADL